MGLKLKDTVVSIFKTLATDQELLTLLEVPSNNMKDIRNQILEDRYPSDLIEDNLSRLCVFENPSSQTYNPNVERGWVEIDIYVTKEKNKVDRRILLIAERLITLLDARERAKVGLPPVEAGIQLDYFNRLPNMRTDSTEWIKYGVVFKYDYIRL